MSPARLYARTAVGLMAAVATIVSVAPASAQSIRVQEDSFIVLTATGVDTSLLTSTGLFLGGLNGETPRIYVVSPSGEDVFEVDGGTAITSVTDQLYVRRDNGISTARIDGDNGNLSLGGNGRDGDLELKDNNFNTTINLDGDSGNAQTSLGGNGFVKGWAQIAADGSVLNCYACDASKTVLIAPDVYLVDFSPVSSDISSRPALVTANGAEGPVFATEPDLTLTSRVRVEASAPTAFTVMVF